MGSGEGVFQRESAQREGVYLKPEIRTAARFVRAHVGAHLRQPAYLLGFLLLPAVLLGVLGGAVRTPQGPFKVAWLDPTGSPYTAALRAYMANHSQIELLPVEGPEELHEALARVDVVAGLEIPQRFGTAYPLNRRPEILLHMAPGDPLIRAAATARILGRLLQPQLHDSMWPKDSARPEYVPILMPFRVQLASPARSEEVVYGLLPTAGMLLFCFTFLLALYALHWDRLYVTASLWAIPIRFRWMFAAIVTALVLDGALLALVLLGGVAVLGEGVGAGALALAWLGLLPTVATAVLLGCLYETLDLPRGGRVIIAGATVLALVATSGLVGPASLLPPPLDALARWLPTHNASEVLSAICLPSGAYGSTSEALGRSIAILMAVFVAGWLTSVLRMNILGLPPLIGRVRR